MKNEKTAKRLQLALSNANMKPQELAEKSGVSKSSISQYVNGSHAPSNISSGKMGDVLGVNPMWLMGFDVKMTEKPTENIKELTSIHLSDLEKEIIGKLKQLNKEGLGKISEYADDLLSSGKYEKLIKKGEAI